MAIRKTAAMEEMPPQSGTLSSEGDGAVVIQRLHRLVRHGYIPLLGYDVASGQDRKIRLHRKGARVTLCPDGVVRFEPALRSVSARTDADGPANGHTAFVAAHDTDGFDAVFPPDTPNKRNVVRRLYEMGLGTW